MGRILARFRAGNTHNMAADRFYRKIAAKSPGQGTIVNVIFAGTPAFAAVALQALLDDPNVRVRAVYTQPDRPAGRGQKVTASPVKQLATSCQIPVLQPLHFRKDTPEGESARAELAQLCQSQAIDVMVVAAYGLILPQAVLDMPARGCLNIHASLLPRWRGAAPIQRAILAGDTETGITIMQMAKGLDTGDMLYKVVTPIANDDTAQTLHDRLAGLGGQAIVTVLNELESYQQQAQPQGESLTTYAHKLDKAAGQIDWQHNADAISRQVRGLAGWPVAFTTLDGTTVRIHAARTGQQAVTGKTAGEIIVVGKQAIAVACGEQGQQVLEILNMQFTGGKALTAEQIAAGNKLQPGQILGAPPVQPAPPINQPAG